MAVRELLLLGNPKLHKKSVAVEQDELDSLTPVIEDLHDTLMHFREKYGVGRGIAAPQIEVFKRVVYAHLDEPMVFVNPRLENLSEEMIEIWDDCMSFPDMLIRVRRHKTCTIVYRDLEWQEHSMPLEGSMSELLQHECDHLDGILAVARAIDGHSFAYKSQRQKAG